MREINEILKKWMSIYIYIDKSYGGGVMAVEYGGGFFFKYKFG